MKAAYYSHFLKPTVCAILLVTSPEADDIISVEKQLNNVAATRVVGGDDS